MKTRGLANHPSLTRSTGLLFVGLFLGLLVGPGQVVAEPPSSEDSRAKLRELLSAYEFIPTREALLRVHPQVDGLLRELALDERPEQALVRHRAITVLSRFPSPETSKTVQSVIKRYRQVQQGLELLLLAEALGTYAVVEGPAALRVLKPFLVHDSLDLRMAAARSVRLCRHTEAVKLLKARAKVDPSKTVRASIEKELRILEKPEARPARPAPISGR